MNYIACFINNAAARSPLCFSYPSKSQASNLIGHDNAATSMFPRSSVSGSSLQFMASILLPTLRRLFQSYLHCQLGSSKILGFIHLISFALTCIFCVYHSYQPHFSQLLEHQRYCGTNPPKYGGLLNGAGDLGSSHAEAPNHTHGLNPRACGRHGLCIRRNTPFSLFNSSLSF